MTHLDFVFAVSVAICLIEGDIGNGKELTKMDKQEVIPINLARKAALKLMLHPRASVHDAEKTIAAEYAPLLEKARELCAVVGTIGSAGEIGRVKAELLALLGEEK